jgi:ArsR family transcriptional regulator, lead/cadmium/zinc/bismuth-responsive transcriptional repressor
MSEATGCLPKPDLHERPLITSEQASELEDVFKVLANDTRLRLLHALARAGELCVSDLAETLGMTPQAVSNQLQRLVDRSVLGSRRSGNSIHYRIVDPCVTRLLDLGLCLAEDARERR